MFENLVGVTGMSRVRIEEGHRKDGMERVNEQSESERYNGFTKREN